MSNANDTTDGADTREHSSRAAARLLGTVLGGGFQLLERIGSGAMGTVFLARQLSVGRNVAVKVMRDDPTPSASQRFLREARVISEIKHPNIVQLIEFGHEVDQNVMYYAMEHIEGSSLSRVLERGRLHPNLAIELATQIASALAEAHARGVVHRDLKASNMIVSTTADGTVRLQVLDFGIAFTFRDTERLTRTGMMCGTPAYMAPEQTRGEAVTEHVDLYALGVNLYQMLSGSLPFTGATPIEIAVKQLQDEPPSLRGYVARGFLPAALVELCEQLMAKDPEGRPPSAVAVRRTLLEIRSQLGWGALVLAPPGASSLQRLIRPRLQDEVGDARPDDAWAPPNATSQTAPLAAPPAPRLAASSRGRESSGAFPRREGGGWDAFNATGPAADDAAALEPMVLSPVTGEFMSVAGSGDASSESPIVAPPPRSPPPPRPAEVGSRRFATEELVVDLPARQGTTVDEVRPHTPFGSDLVRFALIALVAFVMCAGVLAYFLSDARKSAPPAEIEEPADQKAPDPPKVSKPKPPRPKKALEPRKDEPIDIFEDAPEDRPDKPPIIIEEAR